MKSYSFSTSHTSGTIGARLSRPIGIDNVHLKTVFKDFNLDNNQIPSNCLFINTSIVSMRETHCFRRPLAQR